MCCSDQLERDSLKDVIITNILFVPELVNNLLSITALSVHRGFTIIFRGCKVFFNVQDEPIFSATIDIMSYLDGHTLVSSPLHSAKVADIGPTSSAMIEKELLHQRMCHIGVKRLERLITENLTEDLKSKPGSLLPDTRQAASCSVPMFSRPSN